jgi:hypothetical protein
MIYYVIEESDIDACSANGIVACWSEVLDKPITAVCDKSTELFQNNETTEE